MQIPRSWVATEENEYTLSVIQESRHPELQGASVVVTLQRMSQAVTEPEYLTISRQQILASYDAVSFLGDYERTISGRRARCIEVSYSENGNRLYSQSAFAIMGSIVLVFAGVAPIDSSDSVKRVFDKMMSTLVLDPVTLHNRTTGSKPQTRE